MNNDFNPFQYWSERAKKFGKVSVGKIEESMETFEKGSEKAKQKLLPLFARYMTGNESKLLDFGCGFGRFTSDLAEFVTDESRGIDATSELIKIAEEERTNPKTFFSVARGNIPFPDGYFDVVWISWVLEHIFGKEKEKTLKEIYRVLNHGGLLFIIENAASWKKALHCDFRSFK